MQAVVGELEPDRLIDADAITAHDALFGSSIGSTAILTYPDGSRVRVALDSHHMAVLPRLPRGRYSVIVQAGVAIVALDGTSRLLMMVGAFFRRLSGSSKA